MNRWKYYYYRQKGVSHLEKGIPCQDFVHIIEKKGVVVAALADGLGSASKSEIASKIVVNYITNWLIKSTKDFFLGKISKEQIIKECRQAIKNEAYKEKINLKDVDCTLLFIAIYGNKILGGQIGDGAICILKSDSAELMFEPQKGELANSTYTLFTKNIEEVFSLKCVDASKIEGIILTSDGLEGDVYPANSKSVRKAAGTYVNFMLQDNKEEIANHIKELQEGNYYDDISIAILGRKNAKINLPDDPKWICLCGHKNSLNNSYCEKCHEDFIRVYRHVDFSKIDKYQYFRKFNERNDNTSMVKRERIIKIPNTSNGDLNNKRKILKNESKTTIYGEKIMKRNRIEDYPYNTGRKNSISYETQEKKKSIDLIEDTDKKKKNIYKTIIPCILCFIFGMCFGSFLMRTFQPKLTESDYEKIAKKTYQFQEEMQKENILEKKLIQEIDKLEKMLNQLSEERKTTEIEEKNQKSRVDNADASTQLPNDDSQTTEIEY